MARRIQTVNAVTMIGAKFIHWGLALFIFGIVIGYGPLAHYLHGAFEQTGEAFLKNVTLWFGCPWTLSALYRSSRVVGYGGNRMCLLTPADERACG